MDRSSSLSATMPLTWSPLTESNRRPSPYHPKPAGSLRAPQRPRAARTLTHSNSYEPSQAHASSHLPPKLPPDVLADGGFLRPPQDYRRLFRTTAAALCAGG